MNREQYTELKEVQRQLAAVLADPNLSPQARAELQRHAAYVSDALSSMWLPMDWGRRAGLAALIMVGFSSVALYPHYQWLRWAWLATVLMSPRIAGELAFAAGRAKR